LDQVRDSRSWSPLRNLDRLRCDSPALLGYINRPNSSTLEILDLAIDVPRIHPIKLAPTEFSTSSSSTCRNRQQAPPHRLLSSTRTSLTVRTAARSITPPYDSGGSLIPPSPSFPYPRSFSSRTLFSKLSSSLPHPRTFCSRLELGDDPSCHLQTLATLDLSTRLHSSRFIVTTSPLLANRTSLISPNPRVSSLLGFGRLSRARYNASCRPLS